MKAQRGAIQGDFEPGGLVGVAQQPIAQAKRPVVEGTRWGNTHVPVALTPRVILHGGQRARAENFHGGRGPCQLGEPVRIDLGGVEAGVPQHMGQPAAIGGNAIYRGIFQGRGQPGNGLLASVGMDHHLGQHGVEQGGDFQACFEGVVDTQALILGEGDFGQQPRAGAEIVRWVFGI